MIKVKVMDILNKKERNINWLAKKAGIGYSTIYNFSLSKTSAVNYEILEAVCKVLECKIEDILEIIEED
ncbi:helix-turn-helix domain-containing protein [Clostridium tagluense]|uniref:helix-turn-helix domain-containing protein n=1 Tax=Clostridium tagluense TaxID=360422 RepID=UPI001CF535F8|nr:helix-turn-helix transcriptional regulator [Clostridium tagluense]MCB2297071.1 helix-turn-helix transcriptional regulator [Clostridium tagluense]